MLLRSKPTHKADDGFAPSGDRRRLNTSFRADGESDPTSPRVPTGVLARNAPQGVRDSVSRGRRQSAVSQAIKWRNPCPRRPCCHQTP